MSDQEISYDALNFDCEKAVDQIVETIREQVGRYLRRRGAVLGVSGGIDSSVTAALCVRAFGPKKVLALFMPEKDSEDESLDLGRILTAHLGVDSVVENIEPALTAMGCYAHRDAFIQEIVPEFGAGWGCKVVLPNALTSDKTYNISQLVVADPDGEQQTLRMPLSVYQGIIAATNMKQRTRKQIEYYHADRMNYAVAGTPNLLEYDQGFFVKNGDGAADFKPIAHLYKSQVYQLAEWLGLPDEIAKRPPTTDTWSLPQTQEEFYFALPYKQMDMCLYGLNNSWSTSQVADIIGLSPEQVERVWKDIEAKRAVARYLKEPPLLVE